MRLTEYEIQCIKKSVRELDSEAMIYLFGSRVDDSKKGGDIDLLILSKTLSFRDKRKIRIALHKQLGEQKIDILITPVISTPFERIAFSNGILL